MADDDPMAILQRAMQRAYARNLELARQRRQAAVRPALAREMTPQERLEDWLRVRQQPALLASKVQELQARYKLPPEKPVPRRVVEYVIDSVRLERRMAARGEKESDGER